MLTNIVDGFIYNTRIRYLPFRAAPMMLGQMEPLRRAHNYRDQLFVLPPDGLQTPIAAYGQFNKQVRATPGAYLWALSFWEFGAAVAPAVIGPGVSPDHFSLQVVEEASGVEIASEFIPARMYWPGLDNFMPQVLRTQPQLISGEGLISVRIANTDSVAHNCQLILYLVEPCETRKESNPC